MMNLKRMALWFRRCCRLLLLAIVGSMLVLAPVAPAFARKQEKANAALAAKDEGPDNVGAYMIVVACLLVGMTTICRRSPRSAEKKAG